MAHLVCGPGAQKMENRNDSDVYHLATDLLNHKLQFLVKLMMYVLPDPTVQLLGMWLRRLKWIPKDTHKNIHSSTVCKSRIIGNSSMFITYCSANE